MRKLPPYGPSSWWRRPPAAARHGDRSPRCAWPAPRRRPWPRRRSRRSRAATRTSPCGRFFLRHHFGLESDRLGRQAPRRPRGRAARGWWLWWLRGVAWALLGLADWSERRYAWLGGSLVDLQLFKRLEGELDQVYVFALYDRRQYLLLTFLARHTHLTVTAVYQNIPLARNCRHLHVAVPVVLTSKVSLCEVDYYRERGSFLPLSVDLRRPGVHRRDSRPQPHAALYDIGYYSSGEWARREGLYQVTDRARIRRGADADNPYARAAAAQLDGARRLRPAREAAPAHLPASVRARPAQRRHRAALGDARRRRDGDDRRRRRGELAAQPLRRAGRGLAAVVVHLGAARPGSRGLVPARVRRPRHERLRARRAWAATPSTSAAATTS